MREDVSKFTALMNGTWSLWRTVTANAAWERELFEEFAKAFFILAFFRIDLTVSSLKIYRAQHSRRAVAGTSEKNHLEIVFPYKATEMDIDEREPRAGPPMAKKAVLYMLWLQ